ncbi:MAG: transcription-repair coupling factor [Natronospirillum sp.]|uniref:transcription-repair coupling factor n=1 Tax=Natronospirillum sp. TaxID=2812955 RepID=UPI0025E552D3|nr:transcription-repair coupling factor [Natronospirillum sp.]MCH8552888.1 transcription-repair coupling factor [Natronospirillum sp.]
MTSQQQTAPADAQPLTPTELPRQSGDKRRWGNLPAGADAWAVAALMRRHEGQVVVIGSSTTELERLQQETALFMGSGLPASRWLPDWEILPYDTFSPHQDIISDRLSTLYELQQAGKRPAPVFATLSTLLHRFVPKEYVQRWTLRLSVGDTLDIKTFSHRLQEAGYQHASTVTEHGEYTLRGGLVDIFPMGSEAPLRIELFDDDIESIRLFDPDTQRTKKPVERFELLPGREFPLTDEGIAHFRAAFRAEFDADPRQCPLYQDISDGLAPAGIEFYLDLFFDQLHAFFDYLPDNTLLVFQGDLQQEAEHFLADVAQRYENRRHDITRPLLPPHRIYLRADELFGHLKRFPQVQLSAEPVEGSGAINSAFAATRTYPIDHRAPRPLQAVQAMLDSTDARVLFCAETPGRRESLLDLLNDAGIRPAQLDSLHDFLTGTQRLAITVAPLSQGIEHPGAGLRLVSETQLFGEQRVAATRRRSEATTNDQADLAIRNLAEIKPGQPVVHLDHGVGRYQGLETLEVDGQANEFLKLNYANGSNLYVPVTSLHLISRYAGGEESEAPLHKLGTERWANTRRKAAEKIRDTAAELLDVYARREARQGHAFPPVGEDYRRFAAEFPFEETEDQQIAINAVVQDMTKAQPMDRLICGDVGFGKTEVAMRAAFIAAHSGKQVAILVPTTLLAQQHHESFVDRFANWPLRVEVLSRFRTGKETDRVLEGLESGQVDIVIATHKLLSKGIKFKDLGLLIVDEEHRFGVQQKERIKALRANVDILALTATPIPRTLNMAMSSIRDLSIIATPPARRLSVKTFVREHDQPLLSEAIYREIQRGGQVYFLHNEVQNIERVADDIREAIPEARVTIGHGQMRERDLEKVMSDFFHKRYNVLVCTTIIETGIDIPSANTIIINRADKFGLAQLHQLRGRVGRSHHQAYAYLLTPPWKALSGDAQKRLEAISEAQDLGAGFMLATHDLEIRGAGELLGEEQSGHIESIGFSLYMEMLEQAVKALKAGKEPDINLADHSHVEVNLHVPTLIPEDYLPDINTRLTLYKRIASAPDDAALRELKIEMIDRFGLLPEPLNNLFRVTSLRHRLETMGIDKLTCNAEGGVVEFSGQTQVNPFTIVHLVQKQPATYQMRQGDRLGFRETSETAEERFAIVDTLLDRLSQDLQT